MPRAFFYTLLSVNAGLGVAGALFLARWGVPAATAAPIIAAFLLQISLYLVPGFPEVRRRLQEDLAPASLATVAVVAALLPYLIYSVPTGVFHPLALLELAAVSAVPTFVFVLWPTRSRRVTWQDLIVLAVVAVVELGKVVRHIYVSPLPEPRFMTLLGRLMIIGVVATAFLSLRKLKGSGYQFATSAADWKTGIKNFLLFLPLGAAVGVGIRFIHYDPFKLKLPPWQYPLFVIVGFVPVLVLALYEELLFRGVVQNLLTKTMGRPLAAQAAASLVYGLSHVSFRTFPNWNFVIMTTILGWFCGQAYRERQSIVAPAITHALVVTLWRLLFAG